MIEHLRSVAHAFAFMAILLFPNLNEAQSSGRTSDLQFQELDFRNLGPTRGGRVTTVTGVPSQPGTFYQGATGGGVWKTTDYGQSWSNISDGFFASPSIGAIRVAPSDDNILFAGTGSDGLRSNVIAGKGVYKSTDGGKSWKHAGLEKTGHIGAVEIHPDNPDVVFVAAIGHAFSPNPERGLYRTRDGGQNWDRVLYISDTTGITDVEFAPDNPDILYAAAWRGERKPWTIISGGREGGIYKSTDGGTYWQKLGGGLPTGIIGKIDLAVSAADPARVYALIEAPDGIGGVYRSDDYGESWTLTSTKKELLDRPFYYCNIDANPRNADVLFVNSTQFWRSDNGGKSWKRRSTPHGDNHDLWINPLDTLIWIQSNDGGANITRDGGKTWSSQDNQPTAELYQVEVDDQYPYWLYAGQQDNSTIAIPSRPPSNPVAGYTAFWMAVGGCETGPAVPKPGDPNIVYSNCKGRFGVFNKTTGQEQQYYVGAANMYGHNPKDLEYRFQRVSPIHVSPHDPNVVYHTSQFVHRTTDDGKTWETISPDLTAFEPDKQVISGSPITRDITGEEFYSTIYAIRESPLEKGLIWVGANDGPIHVTRNGGRDWKNVTPPSLPPGGRVDAVEPSPHRAAKAYACILRYQLGDWRPYLYRTDNYGQNWTLLTDGKNGIPADYPVRVVREDPDREGLLYAGTEYGLFISFDDGKSWHSFQQNLPITPISDIKVFRQDLILSTMGRGFWILDDLGPLHQRGATAGSIRLFQPRDTYRYRYRGTRKDDVPEYPAPQLLIDYFLEEPVSGELTLEILDDNQQVIRAFTSLKPGKEEEQNQEPDMATGFAPAGFNANLKTNAGHHRLAWDLRYEGAWNSNPQRSGRNGPMAAPGNYFVRLSHGEVNLSQPFKLLIDPRVEAAGISVADIKAQTELNLQIRKLASLANKMAAAVKERQQELSRLKKESTLTETQQREANQLAALESELVAAEGRYTTPMLVDQIRYLASMLNSADQRPGEDARQRYETLKQRYNQLVPQWERLSGKNTELRQLD